MRWDADCYKCGQKGHWAGTCPDEKEKGSGIDGGEFSNSPARVSATSGRADAFVECFVCGQFGHFADQCPSERWAKGTKRGSPSRSDKVAAALASGQCTSFVMTCGTETGADVA